MSDPQAGLFDGLTVLEIGQFVAAPIAAERPGLGFDELHQEHPTLGYGEINGFGDSGPNANPPSVDLIAQSWAGLRVAAGLGEDGELGRYGAYFCDYTAGLLAFGVHTDELLAELGYDLEIIEQLVADGVVARS